MIHFRQKIDYEKNYTIFFENNPFIINSGLFEIKNMD